MNLQSDAGSGVQIRRGDPELVAFPRGKIGDEPFLGAFHFRRGCPDGAGESEPRKQAEAYDGRDGGAGGGGFHAVALKAPAG